MYKIANIGDKKYGDKKIAEEKSIQGAKAKLQLTNSLAKRIWNLTNYAAIYTFYADFMCFQSEAKSCL